MNLNLKLKISKTETRLMLLVLLLVVGWKLGIPIVPNGLTLYGGVEAIKKLFNSG